MLEEDADAILKFMASNGLVANQNKTVFMLLNLKKKKPDDHLIQIRVGENRIEQVSTTKLLGMNIQENLEWSEHFFGKNGLISSLNKRLFAIRRVSNHIC